MKKYLTLGMTFVIVVMAVTLVSAGLFGITGNALWDWNNYCTASSPCDIGEGDCDGPRESEFVADDGTKWRKSDQCKSGYCHLDVGANYGQSKNLDVCECLSGNVWNGTECISESINNKEYYTKEEVDAMFENLFKTNGRVRMLKENESNTYISPGAVVLFNQQQDGEIISSKISSEGLFVENTSYSGAGSSIFIYPDGIQFNTYYSDRVIGDYFCCKISESGQFVCKKGIC